VILKRDGENDTESEKPQAIIPLTNFSEHPRSKAILWPQDNEEI